MVRPASKALALERLKPSHPSCCKSRIGNPRAHRNMEKTTTRLSRITLFFIKIYLISTEFVD